VPTLLTKAIQTLRDEGPAAFAQKAWRKLRFWAEQARLPYVRSMTLEGGETIKVYVNTPFSSGWYTRARAASPELGWIRNALRPGHVVADVGANNGFTGVLFARSVGPSGKVVGFEPSPANLEAARENIRLNAAANFELVAAAVGAQAGKVSFDPGFGNGVVAAAGTVEVPLLTLDEHFGTTRVDLIKVDIEGYELEALRGARQLLTRRPALAIEMHIALYPDREQGLADLFALIDLAAYETSIQLEVDGPIAPFDAAIHTPALIARYHNVHLLALPRASSTGAVRTTGRDSEGGMGARTGPT
jgi:FkbM family methyltransferase